jgi:hypothetical protein
MKVWLFARHNEPDDQSQYWRWTMVSAESVERSKRQPTFEACVDDARQRGFDLSHPHHLLPDDSGGTDLLRA